MLSSRGEDLSRNAFSIHDLNDHALAQEPLPMGIMRIIILVDPALVIIITSIYSVCLIYAQEKTKFKRNITILHFLLQNLVSLE